MKTQKDNQIQRDALDLSRRRLLQDFRPQHCRDHASVGRTSFGHRPCTGGRCAFPTCPHDDCQRPTKCFLPVGLGTFPDFR